MALLILNTRRCLCSPTVIILSWNHYCCNFVIMRQVEHRIEVFLSKNLQQFTKLALIAYGYIYLHTMYIDLLLIVVQCPHILDGSQVPNGISKYCFSDLIDKH